MRPRLRPAVLPAVALLVLALGVVAVVAAPRLWHRVDGTATRVRQAAQEATDPASTGSTPPDGTSAEGSPSPGTGPSSPGGTGGGTGGGTAAGATRTATATGRDGSAPSGSSGSGSSGTGTSGSGTSGSGTSGSGTSGTTSSARTAPAAAVSGRPLGVADPDLIGASAASQTSQIAAMKALGITAVRLDARWDWVQYGGPTSYDWKDLDRTVGNLRAAGLTVDLLVAGCPTWAAAADRSSSGACHPASAAQFGQWAGAVAARFHPQGVRLYEIWNEPNQAASWGPAADPAAFAAILAAAFQAIKKVSSDTVVLSGGLAPTTTAGGDVNGTSFLASVYAHGGKGTFDAVGYHAYCYPALPDSVQSWSGWSQMAATSPSLRSVMTANGDSGKQIWITEAGAPTAGPHGVGEQAQAQTITQAVAGAASASWVGGLFLYTWRDAGTDAGDSEDWFGLTTEAGTGKPALAALQRAIAASWR